MARLPQPGGDNGTWGDILNEYLSQTLKPDGTLKADAVSAAAIIDGSISETLLDTAVRAKLNASTGAPDWTTITNKPAVIAAGASQAAARTAIGAGTQYAVSVKDYGATGNGTTDDTAAVQNAYTAAHAAGMPLYFPRGVYVVTTLPALADYDYIIGAGPRVSTIKYTGTTTLSQYSNLYGVLWRDIGLWATGVGATLLQLSNCFRFSFTNVIFRGEMNSSATTFHGQVGLKLDNNTGATSIINCDFENLGIGLQTSCIQNHMVNGKFTSCWRSVHGVGGSFSAGMHFTQVEFIGLATGNATETHVYIDGSADSWTFTACWFEKCVYAARIGISGIGGPAQFAMFGGKIAASTVGIQLNHCRQPHLSAIKFDVDDNGTMTEIVIDPANVPEGAAYDLVTTIRGDFSDADFPQYWTVTRKGQLRGGDVTVRSQLSVTGSGHFGSSVTIDSSTSLNSGSGVPDNQWGADGDFYFRTGATGTANQRIYIKSAGVWVGIV